jgi:glycosyltransferase involved in cell wall biosynthesis
LVPVPLKNPAEFARLRHESFRFLFRNLNHIPTGKGLFVAEKITILIFTQGYLPGFKWGGPVQSIAGLVEALGDEYHFKIITSDKDLNDTSPYLGIQQDSWIRVGNAEVYYLSPNKRTFFCLRSLINRTHFDILYLNSFFSIDFSIKPILLAFMGLINCDHVLIAPRGEFSPGALALKAFKKRVYIRFAKMLKLYSQVHWQASSLHEKQHILRTFAGSSIAVATAPIFIASDVSPTNFSNTGSHNRQKFPGTVKIVFLSRISPMKNLIGALNSFIGIKGNIVFDIYGPAEDSSYWNKCEKIIGSLSANIKVDYKGTLPHNEVISVLSKYHLFFLPTLGENFGHVISEALLSACPVLISDQTPWRNLENKGVGWDLPLDSPEKFTQVIQQCVDMDHVTFQAMSARARTYGIESAQDTRILQQNRDMFLSFYNTSALK